MRNSSAIQKPSQFFWNRGREVRHSRSSIFLLGGIVFLLATCWLGGCSSTPKSTSDPSKQEVQGDSDRFFKNLFRKGLRSAILES